MATPRTGRPRGRPKGSKTLRKRQEKPTVEHIEAMVEKAITIEAPDLEPFKGGAVEYLMSIYKDPRQPHGERLKAAKAAAPYESPALQSVVVTKRDAYSEIEDADELRRALQAEAVAAGIASPPDARKPGRARGEPGPVRH